MLRMTTTMTTFVAAIQHGLEVDDDDDNRGGKTKVAR